jgi:hypothetical protein
LAIPGVKQIKIGADAFTPAAKEIAQQKIPLTDVLIMRLKYCKMYSKGATEDLKELSHG